ncbi:MAG: proteasome-activating nucleotidase [Candidatus Diapherotrites archaeon]
MDVKAEKKPVDIYEYVYSLEQQLRSLHSERQIISTRSMQLEQELQRLRTEVNELRATPLVVGNVVELFPSAAIVRNTNGVEFWIDVPAEKRKEISVGARVAMTQRSLSIVHILPEGKDPRAKAMEVIDRPKITFEEIGGLEKQVRELEEAVILPLTNPEKFKALGIEPPNGVLLYGEPGTGKTLLAKAVANKTNSTFIGITGSELVRKYIGEGAKLVRDVFKMAKEQKSAIIFIDEIDSIGAFRIDDSSGGDREVQRTMMQLLAELDGFKDKENVKILAATNRIDILDPALLRAGRFDRIIEVPIPDEKSRLKIFQIHARKMKLGRGVELEKLAFISEGCTGADIRTICIEAGMSAMRLNKKTVENNHFVSAVQKVLDSKLYLEDKAPDGMLA